MVLLIIAVHCFLLDQQKTNNIAKLREAGCWLKLKNRYI